MERRVWVLFLITGLLIACVPPVSASAKKADCSGVQQEVSHEIYQIQGAGTSSPIEGESVTTCGTVIAISDQGYWMQDTTGDKDASTSEGIFVYHPSADVAPGQVVKQQGTVKEYHGLTELSSRSAPDTIGSGSLPDPVELTASVAYDDLETLEGMRVTLKEATVVAGSNQHGETFVVPGTRTTRVHREDTTTPLLKLDDKLEKRVTGASTFDRVSGNLTGPLDYAYGAYALQWNQGSADVADTGNTENRLPADDGNLTITTFNVENYFGVGSEISPGDPDSRVSEEAFKKKTAKLSIVIRRHLGSPDLLAVQEVEKKEVLEALADRVSADGGPRYTPYLMEGNDGRGIDVAYLVKEGIKVRSVEQVGESATTKVEDCGPLDTDLLFSRPPLVLRVEDSEGRSISLINNHFKSKGGPDSCRNAQAEFVADVANREADEGHSIVVLGDLNAFPDEQAVQMLESQAKLTNLVDQIPDPRAFSYIYSGKTQFLDHLLVSSDLSPRTVEVDSAKMNPDFPVSDEQDDSTALRVSDHDPLRVEFGRK